MQITPVDSENNLFKVEDVFSDNLVKQILATDWESLPWDRQEGQESWSRRRIRDSAIPWLLQWDTEIRQVWDTMSQTTGFKFKPYFGTAFWLDEPGFTCGMHTDGEMPGSLHMTWVGPGTSFYWHKDPNTLRYRVLEQPNAGYIMINKPDDTGYRKLLWHAMLEPSPTFRITSYTWITPE
jgi:hypothetical protein